MKTSCSCAKLPALLFGRLLMLLGWIPHSPRRSIGSKTLFNPNRPDIPIMRGFGRFNSYLDFAYLVVVNPKNPAQRSHGRWDQLASPDPGTALPRRLVDCVADCPYIDFQAQMVAHRPAREYIAAT
uniref:Uncharacterized protein n=1 Tax=uncultured marine virus TaxID=186617 RepID=A0A0F7L094_9VIRU|nr:hypothetical protein [uncultured marine virus]